MSDGNGDKQNPEMIRKCLAIISDSATKSGAYKALKAAGITGGLSLECWVAYNNLPNA